MTEIAVKKLESKDYKTLIKRHLYLKNYGGVVEESVNHWNADIIGVNFKNEVNEFEIKVSTADLKGEVKAIKRALQGNIYQNVQSGQSSFSYNRVEVEEKVSLTKLEKHYCYLVGGKKQRMTFGGTKEEESLLKRTDPERECFVPSKFYFAVPTDMIDLAKNLLTDVPYYGIMNADTGEIKKPARSLPRANVRRRDLMNLFMRACTEWRDTSNSLSYYKGVVDDGHHIRVKRAYKWTDLRGDEHVDWY